MRMDQEKLQKQYDRFLSQVREEAKDLYWLYNFFFVVESALLGALLMGRLNPTYLPLAATVGITLSIYWFIIVRKQRLWRNDWTRRIQTIEEALEHPEQFQMWPESLKKEKSMKAYIIGRRGLWRFLFLLPIGFAVVWASLLLGN